MNAQPEALRLADELDQYLYSVPAHPLCTDAAAELRRLHAENEAMRNVANRGGHIAVAMSRIADLESQRDALLEALLRIESAVDWYLGRSSFTQTTQLKGLKHSANVRKELFAAHDEVRAAIKAVEEGK